MNTQADQKKENKSRTAANTVFQKQNDSASVLQFVNNHPEAIAQRKLQDMANNSLQAMQFKAFQKIANNSLKAKQAAQLQAMLDNRPESPTQKKLKKISGNEAQPVAQRVIDIENPEAELPKTTEGMDYAAMRGLIQKLMPVHGVTIPSITGLELMHRGKKVTFNTWKDALDEADRLGWADMGMEKPPAPEVEAPKVSAPKVLNISSVPSLAGPSSSSKASAKPVPPKNLTWSDLILTKGAPGDTANIIGNPWINMASKDGTVNFQCIFKRGTQKLQFQIHIHPQVPGLGVDTIHMKDKSGGGGSSLIPQAIFVMIGKSASTFKAEAKKLGEGQGFDYSK